MTLILMGSSMVRFVVKGEGKSVVGHLKKIDGDRGVAVQGGGTNEGDLAGNRIDILLYFFCITCL